MTGHKYTPAVAGVVGIVAVVVAADVHASYTDRPTISAGFADALGHSIAGPAAFGVGAGLFWHLVIDPVLKRLERSGMSPVSCN